MDKLFRKTGIISLELCFYTAPLEFFHRQYDSNQKRTTEYFRASRSACNSIKDLFADKF